MAIHTFMQATNDEWKRDIDNTIAAIKLSDEPKAVPQIPISKTVDHTLLKLDATPEHIDTLCNEARRHDFATVCVRPGYVERCVKSLKGTDVKVASVIGFHEGTYDTNHKLKEIQESLASGAAELDVVINWPQLKALDYVSIIRELVAIRHAAPRPTLLKLIFETSQLSDAEIVAACVLASSAEFDYVKTSTGFLGHGAKVEHVRLMSAACDYLDGDVLVKASGGVRSLEDAVTMLKAGANRLGTSAGVAIATQAYEVNRNGHSRLDTATGESSSSTEY